MSDSAELAKWYIGMRPGSSLLGWIALDSIRDAIPDAMLNKIHCFKVRSLTGETFQARIRGRLFVFIDDVAFEYANDLHKVARSDHSAPMHVASVIDAMDCKRISRVLYLSGYVYAALIAMQEGLERSSSVLYGKSALASPDGDGHFARVFEDISISHEIGHILSEYDPNQFDAYVTEARSRMERSTNLFFDDGVLDRLRDLIEEGKGTNIRVDYDTLLESVSA